MAKAVLNFAVYRDGALERRESIAQDIVKVGKDPKSHLRVDDDAASRMHAVIEVGGPEDITLIDLGNEPGTLVNGARVNKCKIHVGDRIERRVAEGELAVERVHDVVLLSPFEANEQGIVVEGLAVLARRKRFVAVGVLGEFPRG